MNKTIKSKQIVDVLELPKDIVNGIPYLNFEGNVGLTIDNHKGIMKYNEEEINIQTKHFLVKITGKELSILEYSKYIIVIKGKIEVVQFVS